MHITTNSELCLKVLGSLMAYCNGFVDKVDLSL